MDFSSLVLMEKDKETGFITKELGSFEVNEGALYVRKLFVVDNIVNLYFDTNKALTMSFNMPNSIRTDRIQADNSNRFSVAPTYTSGKLTLSENDFSRWTKKTFCTRRWNGIYTDTTY